MVKSKCSNIRASLTNEEIENITDEIYNAIEGESINAVKTNMRHTRQPEIPRSEISRIEVKKEIKSEQEKSETRQFNSGLRDLIKILLIRELINRPERPGMRPPMPARPPFRSGQQFFPFDRNDKLNLNDDIYEY